MSKEFILKFAKGKEGEPIQSPPVHCYFHFDEDTREIVIESCKVMEHIEAPNIFVTNYRESGIEPTETELNEAINKFLKNEKPVKYTNSNRDFYLKLCSTGIPFAENEDEIDLQRYYGEYPFIQ